MHYGASADFERCKFSNGRGRDYGESDASTRSGRPFLGHLKYHRSDRLAPTLLRICMEIGKGNKHLQGPRNIYSDPLDA